MGSVRICYLLVEDFTRRASGGDTKEFYLLTKYFKNLINMSQFDNVTFVTEKNVGSLVDPERLEYNGCIGSLQRNESDMSLQPSLYAYYGPNVTILNAVTYDIINIATVYKRELASSTSPVLDFLSSYSLVEWLVTVMLILSICCVIIAKTAMLHSLLSPQSQRRLMLKIKGTGKRAMKILVSCAFKQHPNCNQSQMSRITSWMYIFMTLLMFFTVCFLTSMIKTEMVVLKKPDTYDSYQDLLDHDVITWWMTDTDGQRPFQQAKEGSLQKQLWDRAVSKGIEKSLISLTAPGNLSVLDTFIAVAKRKAVGLLNRLVMLTALQNACCMSRSLDLMTDIYGYIKVDQIEQEVLRVVTASAFAPESLRKLLKAQTVNLIERDFFIPEFLRTFSHVLASNAGHIHEVEECASNKIMMPEHNLVPAKISYYEDLITVCTALYLLSLVVLVIEVMIYLLKKTASSSLNQATASRI